METKRTYEELDVIAVPDDVPEASITAGMLGAVVDIKTDGTLLTDVVTEDGRMLYIDPEPRVVERWHFGEA